jgi:hypothetical protein
MGDTTAGRKGFKARQNGCLPRLAAMDRRATQGARLRARGCQGKPVEILVPGGNDWLDRSAKGGKSIQSVREKRPAADGHILLGCFAPGAQPAPRRYENDGDFRLGWDRMLVHGRSLNMATSLIGPELGIRQLTCPAALLTPDSPWAGKGAPWSFVAAFAPY